MGAWSGGHRLHHDLGSFVEDSRRGLGSPREGLDGQGCEGDTQASGHNCLPTGTVCFNVLRNVHCTRDPGNQSHLASGFFSQEPLCMSRCQQACRFGHKSPGLPSLELGHGCVNWADTRERVSEAAVTGPATLLPKAPPGKFAPAQVHPEPSLLQPCSHDVAEVSREPRPQGRKASPRQRTHLGPEHPSAVASISQGASLLTHQLPSPIPLPFFFLLKCRDNVSVTWSQNYATLPEYQFPMDLGEGKTARTTEIVQSLRSTDW